MGVNLVTRIQISADDLAVDSELVAIAPPPIQGILDELQAGRLRGALPFQLN